MSLDGLISRDGPECLWCGAAVWRRDLTVEHVLPRARGGRTVEENLAVACRRCNPLRRTRAVVAFVRAQLLAGRTPRVDLVVATLERLSRSSHRAHAEYGRRQLALLCRLPECERLLRVSAGS